MMKEEGKICPKCKSSDIVQDCMEKLYSGICIECSCNICKTEYRIWYDLEFDDIYIKQKDGRYITLTKTECVDDLEEAERLLDTAKNFLVCHPDFTKSVVNFLNRKERIK